jgi:DNA polymerase-3 subunit alpha
MFDLWGQSVDTPLPGLELPQSKASPNERLAWERELLGVHFSEHPFAQVYHRLASEIDVFCGQVTEDMVGQVIVTAGTIISLRQSLTRDRRPFVSAMIEDFAGSVEVTAWPDVYEQTKDIWQQGNTLVIKAKVKTRNDSVQLTCLKASLYDPGQTEPKSDEFEQPHSVTHRHQLSLTFTTSDDPYTDVDRLELLFDILRQYPGQDEVRLSVIDGEEVTRLEIPNMTTGYTAELHQQLSSILGEGSLTLRELASGQAQP